jgi:hypothetical protein
MESKTIEKINNIIEIFNSISIAVNGSNADILSKYEKIHSMDISENEYIEQIDFDKLREIYDYTNYLSFLNFSKKNIDNAKIGEYKSQVSERMKMQLINSIEITKTNIIQEININKILLEEKEESFSYNFLKIHLDKKESEDNIIKLFNYICKHFLKIYSELPSVIIRIFSVESKNYSISHILKLNLQLILNNLRPVEVRKYKRVVDSVSEYIVKKIEYPKYFCFNKIFMKNNDIKFKNLKNYEGELKENNIINYLLKLAFGKDVEFGTNNMNDKLNLLKEWSVKNNTIIIILNTDNKDYIYNIKNLLGSDSNNSSQNSSEISGITKEYVLKTNTIKDSIDGEVEDYISPISIQIANIYNYVDIMESEYKDLDRDIVILRIDKNLKKSTMHYGIKIINNMELLNPQLFNLNSVINNHLYEYSITNIKQSIEDIKVNREDMNVFTPVKLSDIRANVLSELKDYKRHENKLENTNKIIHIIFNSIYKAIWSKTPKTKDFNDEFYMTFYASINRLVFKARKDFMDRYNLMRNFESTKEVVMDILEKMEKNILKSDEMITIKYNLIN